MRAPTQGETEAYAAMQARLIELLLRHDDQSFQRFFGERQEYQPQAEHVLIRRYRELGVIFHLRDELFEDILPRIVRRLSFESPRNVIVEEPPGHGRVDWERTLDAAWADRPGEPPLMLHTRQRRRHFATPENLLTVATLLQYQEDIQFLLREDPLAMSGEVMTHPLNDIVARCERELAFPQFAGLRGEAQQLIEQSDDDLESIEIQVGEHSVPGANNAYHELIEWRRRRRSLRLLDRIPTQQTESMLGADPQRDNYLYQIWIFFELADMLKEQGRLEQLNTAEGQMTLCFRWEEEGQSGLYELRHDRGLEKPIAHWRAEPKTARVPGVRPDFHIRRLELDEAWLKQNTTAHWREPGVIWDAKYYQEQDRLRVPSGPIKRMLADMALLGERHGVLLFAFQKLEMAQEPGGSLPSAELAGAETLAPHADLRPLQRYDQTVMPDQVVKSYPLQPGLDVTKDTRSVLITLLKEVHRELATPRVPICQGIFLDTLSINPSVALLDRYGVALDDDPAELLICPKPHIGPWRIDLVSRKRHCCQDPALCHIVNQPSSAKPLRPPRNADELLKELQSLFTDQAQIDEEAVNRIARQVEEVTRRFAEIAGAYKKLDSYFEALRDLGMDQSLHLLQPPEQESLALAMFLREELRLINASDFSAPAIHLSSVMELEIKRRVFQCPGLHTQIADTTKQTLGRLPGLQRDPNGHGGAWLQIESYVRQHWDEQIDPARPEQHVRFVDFVGVLPRIAQIRNHAAHTDPVTRDEYRELQTLMFQISTAGPGALNALLLAWRS